MIGLKIGEALFGGVLIGLSAGLMIYLLGRIAGISGLISGVINRAGDWTLRLAFLVGLLVSPWLFLVKGGGLVSVWHNPPPFWLLVLAGLLVGMGTRLGSGCTSGHGVCGLARLSKRSLAATMGFILAGMLVVGVVRHLLG